MEKEYIMALDQGTTSSRAVIFDRQGKVVSIAAKEFEQIYPRPGWVEHDPVEIWDSQMEAARKALDSFNLSPQQIAAIGVTNQRETTLIWDRESGRPVYNAIVWQCRRTAPACSKIKKTKFAHKIRKKTGLVIDAYFSATKVQWILGQQKTIRRAAERGELAFGTVDSWLVYHLTGKKLHITDYSNASRTMLYNIHDLSWDGEILEYLDIPGQILPAVKASSEIYGSTSSSAFLALEVPVAGIVGDQQGALFGQTCFRKGLSKNTYGTGCFLLMNIGGKPVLSRKNLLTTIAWGIGRKIEYALEGSVFIGGAVVQWLRDGLRIIQQASESERLATSLQSNDGVYFVPAFVGLGAPYWDMYARGTILGITRGTTQAHITRAALESIAYQTRDVLECMEEDSGMKLKELRVDGGAAANEFLMQFQADILGVPVIIQETTETTALGAAYLAGLAVGFWKDQQQIAANYRVKRKFIPRMSSKQRECLYRKWKRAVERARGWEQVQDDVT
ncbi:MAG TPA: glycerol kinase GlpK [Thermodesulfobacteriota bacterium]|nr:glycerol kinase GlpK [Thermodesulfobacteriota bacterium]